MALQGSEMGSRARLLQGSEMGSRERLLKGSEMGSRERLLKGSAAEEGHPGATARAWGPQAMLMAA